MNYKLGKVQFTEDGEEIISTNFYDLPESDDKCFMIYTKYVLKILTQKYTVSFKKTVSDAKRTLIYKFNDFLKVTILTKSEKEQDFEFVNSFNSIFTITKYKEEQTILEEAKRYASLKTYYLKDSNLSQAEIDQRFQNEFNFIVMKRQKERKEREKENKIDPTLEFRPCKTVKFYYSDENQNLILLNSLPAIFTHQKKHSGKFGTIEFIESEQELIAINLLEWNNNTNSKYCFMSFFGGTLKIKKTTIYFKEEIEKAQSVKVYKSGGVIRMALISEVGAMQEIDIFSSINDLFDPEENISKLKKCTVKIYYSKDTNSIELLNTLPGIITDEEYKLGNFLRRIYFLDNGENIINTNYYSLSDSKRRCFMSIRGGVLKVLTHEPSVPFEQDILEAERANVYKFLEKIRITIISKTGNEQDFDFVVPESDLNDPEFLIISREMKIQTCKIKFYKRKDDQQLTVLKTLPASITDTFFNYIGPDRDVNFIDTGKDIIATDYYYNSFRPSPRGCFMSFYGGVLKVLIFYSYLFLKEDSSSAVSAKVYKTPPENPYLIQLNIINNNNEEKNYKWRISLNNLFDPEGNVFKLDHFNVKIYYSERTNDKLHMVKTLPGVISKVNEIKVIKEQFYFIDNGQDIISTNYYHLASNKSLISFYGGILKILIPKQFFPKRKVITDADAVYLDLNFVYRRYFFILTSDSIQNGFDPLTWEQLFSGRIYDEYGDKITNSINRNTKIGLKIKHDIYDPDGHMLRDNETFRIKFYYSDDNTNIIMFKELPFYSFGKYYLDYNRSERKGKKKHENFEINNENTHFIDNGEDIIFSTYDYLLIFHEEIFKMIVPYDYFNLTRLTLIFTIDGDAEGDDNLSLPEIGESIYLNSPNNEGNQNYLQIYGSSVLPFSEDFIKVYRIKIYYRKDDSHIVFLKELPLIYKVKVFRRR